MYHEYHDLEFQMPFELKIPTNIEKLYPNWKIKIREKERLEPPHVTILFRKKAWRWNLRDKEFMDKEPNPKDIPDALIKLIKKDIDKLIKEWNEMYSENTF